MRRYGDKVRISTHGPSVRLSPPRPRGKGEWCAFWKWFGIITLAIYATRLVIWIGSHDPL